MAKNKIVIFIDCFKEKNRLQHNLMNEFGFQTIWFQTSSSICENTNIIFQLKTSFIPRLIQVTKFLWLNRKEVHHVELYPGGRFAFMYLVISKLFKLPTLCCERGDIYYYVNKKYDFLTRISQFIIYKYSDYLWLRELFAEEYLQKSNLAREHFFIHNVVPIPPKETLPSFEERDIDFLWVNSLKSFRKVEWFSEALEQDEFKHTNNLLLGLTEGAFKNEFAQIEKKQNLNVHGFDSPYEYYRRAKYFILPATIIYLNHSLLEAMSYGVIPIITEAQGADLIIDNQQNGFITSFEKTEFIQAMKNALSLSKENFEKISINARKKIINDYSESYYKNELFKMYTQIK